MKEMYKPVDIRQKLNAFITYQAYMSEAKPLPDVQLLIETSLQIANQYPQFVYKEVQDNGIFYIVYGTTEFTKEEAISYIKLQQGVYSLDYFEEQEKPVAPKPVKEQKEGAVSSTITKQICVSCVPKFVQPLYATYEDKGVLAQTLETKKDVVRLFEENPKIKVFFFSFAYIKDDVIHTIRTINPKAKVVLIGEELSDTVKVIYQDLVDEFVEVDDQFFEQE